MANGSSPKDHGSPSGSRRLGERWLVVVKSPAMRAVSYAPLERFGRKVPVAPEMPDPRTVSVRPHTDAFTECTIVEETYRSLIRGWLGTRPVKSPPVSNVFLGRLVDYPWLSQALALRAYEHPSWDASRSRSRDRQPNSLVQAILSEPALIVRLQEPFVGSALAVSGLSVEKVLLGRLADVLPADSGRGGRRPLRGDAVAPREAR